ncbi:MAG: DUF2007 domain-containing protein [Bacteroidaceae bacterium]|nr:DUF2007 domain-containing protein [Bacteroidaceae bacterium]
MYDKEKVVTIRQYASDIEASMMRDRLENAGIPCMLTNETFSSIYPISHTTLGAIRLLVFERDVQAAIKVIDNTNTEE